MDLSVRKDGSEAKAETTLAAEAPPVFALEPLTGGPPAKPERKSVEACQARAKGVAGDQQGFDFDVSEREPAA